GNGDVGELDLDPAELDPLVVLEVAGCGDEGALAEPGDLVGEGVFCRGSVCVERAGVHQLHGTRLVAQHHELHLLLVADGVDPARHAHGAVGCCGQVLDQGAFSHHPSLKAGKRLPRLEGCLPPSFTSSATARFTTPMASCMGASPGTTCRSSVTRWRLLPRSSWPGIRSPRCLPRPCSGPRSRRSRGRMLSGSRSSRMSG